MRLAFNSLWLTCLAYLLCLTSITPAASRPFTPTTTRVHSGLDLGGGWVFSYTNLPSLFVPVQTAAQSLDHLYEIAKISATARENAPSSRAMYSAYTTFRIGHFALVFRGDFDDSYDNDWKSRVSWPAIITFCEKMQALVKRGETLYYEGIITGAGAGGVILVQLNIV